MPVTAFQAKVAKLLAINRSSDSYLAGGAAMHFEPNSIRYSNDLDYFHDSEIRVASAFEADEQLLREAGIEIVLELRQPGYVRVIARDKDDATKIEWAHDSAWRFMPTAFIEDRGFCLHPIDLAINKTLALAGRDEARDFLDVMHAHNNLLGLPGLVWAACGKDPGFSPNSLLELLQRKGRYHAVDFKRLRLNREINLQELKTEWLQALDQTRNVISYFPAADLGCLYYDQRGGGFKVPERDTIAKYLLHFATVGGVLPQILKSEPVQTYV
jgi:hypothetical protein